MSKRATRRLREIADYKYLDNPAAARNVQSALRRTLALIASRPSMGRGTLPDVRSFAVPRLPYLTYYRVDQKKDAVTIITIRHTAQKRPIQRDQTQYLHIRGELALLKARKLHRRSGRATRSSSSLKHVCS